MDSREELHDRFRLAIRAYLNAHPDETSDTLGTRLKVIGSTIRNYMSSASGAVPPVERWPDYARELGVSVQYLMYGEDASDAIQRIEFLQRVQQATAQLAALETRLEPLLHALEGAPLDDFDRAALRELAAAIAETRRDNRPQASS